jgi:transcriptional regulator with XRE-family HTH domain
MGMRPQTLTKYLNGTRIPGNTVKQRLQDIGCDIDWLMTGRTGSAPPGHLVSAQQKDLLDELHKVGIRNRDDWRDFLSVVEEMDSTASSIRERLKKYRL